MIKDWKYAEIPSLDSWLVEIKAELADAAEIQSKKYNFDFSENRPGKSSEHKLQWELSKSKPLVLGVRSLKEDQSDIENSQRHGSSIDFIFPKTPKKANQDSLN